MLAGGLGQGGSGVTFLIQSLGLGPRGKRLLAAVQSIEGVAEQGQEGRPVRGDRLLGVDER